MKYTKESLHGIVYKHHSDGHVYKKIIRLSTPSPRGFQHTTCNNATGKSESPWFTDEQAIRWLESGIWVVKDKPQEIINQYEIY